MHKFNYSFLKGKVDAVLSNSVSVVDRLQGYLDGYRTVNSEFLENLKEQSILRSTEASNAIEGIQTSKDRLNSLVLGVLLPNTHDELELLGYSKALREIHLKHDELEFNTKTILQLYGIMMSRVPGVKTQFKTTDNLILGTTQGINTIVFRPVPAKETEFAMNQLELAFISAWNDTTINKLLLIPCVIADFLCIHPFTDGNGRMSRLLSVLLLYKAGYNITSFFSFEEQINDDRAFYYQALREVSDTWYIDNPNYSQFILNFLVSLYGCYRQIPMDY